MVCSIHLNKVSGPVGKYIASSFDLVVKEPSELVVSVFMRNKAGESLMAGPWYQ
jgi:hypothetical protein